MLKYCFEVFYLQNAEKKLNYYVILQENVFSETKTDNCVEIYCNDPSQESAVNNVYQCLIAMSMQHVIIFTYLFINVYNKHVTQTLRSYTYFRFPE